MKPPIILVGTQRSGTTWLGGLFARHPRVAYWEEPRHVWTWGNAYKPDDLLTEDDARPRVARHIRRAFERYARRRGKERVVEKTPSNCLRLRFIRAVLPEARIVLIVRDGRSVIRSTAEIMEGSVRTDRVINRALGAPIWEWPAYAPQAWRMLGAKLGLRRLDYWGARPPGWRRWVKNDPREIMLAKQWSATISRALDDAETIGSDRILRFRYEDLMAEPRSLMRDVVDFTGLEDAEDIIEEVARTADPQRQSKWREMIDQETLDRIRPIMEPTLRRLGYEW